jgi:hypothetical protein
MASLQDLRCDVQFDVMVCFFLSIKGQGVLDCEGDKVVG